MHETTLPCPTCARTGRLAPLLMALGLLLLGVSLLWIDSTPVSGLLPVLVLALLGGALYLISLRLRGLRLSDVMDLGPLEWF